jgi:hypothetical protein
LTAVSFDRILFAKEYRKLIGWMSDDERTALTKWCLKNIDKATLLYAGIALSM